MDKIYKDGYDYFFWQYEEQTKIKHFVVNEYFDKWIKILGSQNNNLFYFDCYGGSGAYIENGQEYYGSPVLAGETIEKNRSSLGRNVNLVIIEKEQENIDNIIKIFQKKSIAIKPIVINGDFDNEINKILDANRNLPYPALFFIDPFGFSVKYETIKRILSVPRHEIILNFMFNSVSRFLIDDVANILDGLFGCNEWKQLRILKGNEREEAILNLFRNQLKKLCRYVFPYRMSFPTKERTYYYLFHLSNKAMGCSIMKSAFAKYNDGKVEYLGKLQGAQTIFDMDSMKEADIKQYLQGRFANHTVSFNSIIDQIIDEIPYLEGNIKTSLKSLEKDGAIRVERVESKTQRGLQGEDIIFFSYGR